VSARWVSGSWWPAATATNFAWHGSWHISSPWLRIDSFPRDCELLTTASAWPTVEGQSSRKHQMGSVKERFPQEATSKEICWSRLVDGKEPVCPFAGTFVMTVGALDNWAIYTHHSCTTGNRLRNLCYDSWSLSHLGYSYPGTTPVMIKLDHNRTCPWV